MSPKKVYSEIERQQNKSHYSTATADKQMNKLCIQLSPMAISINVEKCR